MVAQCRDGVQNDAPETPLRKNGHAALLEKLGEPYPGSAVCFFAIAEQLAAVSSRSNECASWALSPVGQSARYL